MVLKVFMKALKAFLIFCLFVCFWGQKRSAVYMKFIFVKSLGQSELEGLSSYISKSKGHWATWANPLSIWKSLVYGLINGLLFLEHIMFHVLLLWSGVCLLLSGILVCLFSHQLWWSKKSFLKKNCFKVFQGALLLSVREGAKTQDAYIPGKAMTPLHSINLQKKWKDARQLKSANKSTRTKILINPFWPSAVLHVDTYMSYDF